MPIVSSKSKYLDTQISRELEEKVFFSLIEDVNAEKEKINLQAKINYSLLEDVAAQKKKVDAEKSRINAAVQNLTDGLASFDEHGQVLDVNPRMTQITGLPIEGFYIDEFAKLFKGVDVSTKINTAMKERKKFHVEEVVLLKQFYYEIFFTPVIDSTDTVIGSLILLHDITHMKEVDRMKSEFVSIASHQLRTPLTAINWLVESMQSDDTGEMNNNTKKSLDGIYQSSQRMVTLVNDLLNVSRLESGRLKIEPVQTQIEDLIQKIIDEAAPLVAENACKIIFHRPNTKLPVVSVDITLMQQVIHNLIMNAIRYSPVNQCDIVVKAELQDNKTTATSNSSQSNILISVSDSGIGIPKDVQPRIFEKFFRADNAKKITSEGSGMGMYIVKMIIEASGGKIWFESEGSGKGTTFYVTLPLVGMKKKSGEKGLAK